jgi:hypothetical protein
MEGPIKKEENKPENLETSEQSPSDKKIYLEQGLDKWLDLVANKEWTLKNMPEREEIWRTNQEKSTLTDLVSEAQHVGHMKISHYWHRILGHLYGENILQQTENTNEFCKQNDIPFAFDEKYIERIKMLSDKLLPESPFKSKPIPPKDTKIYDIDPILIPFIPHIKEIEKFKVIYPSINKKTWAWYHEVRKQIEGDSQIIQRIQAILDDAEKSGSSWAIGNEAKEAIDLYLENVEQKRRLYELLKERGIKIPTRLTWLATKSILECALFEKRYNSRIFSPFLFSSSEQFREFEESHKEPACYDGEPEEEIKIINKIKQQILGQEFIDLQEDVTQKEDEK